MGMDERRSLLFLRLMLIIRALCYSPQAR